MNSNKIKYVLVTMAFSMSFSAFAEPEQPFKVLPDGQTSANERESVANSEEEEDSKLELIDLAIEDLKRIEDHFRMRRSKKNTIEAQWQFFEFMYKESKRGDYNSMDCPSLGMRARFINRFEKRIYRSEDFVFNESAYVPMKKELEETLSQELEERCPDTINEIRKEERRESFQERRDDRNSQATTSGTLE